MDWIDVPGAPLAYDAAFGERLANLDERVTKFRQAGKLDAEGLRDLSRFFKVRTIYNSNAIEGNSLDEGETQRVVEQGMTIAGHSMKDHLEARNLAKALEFIEELAVGSEVISENDIRQVHQLILKGIDDENAGAYRSSDVEITGSSFKTTSYLNVPHEMGEFGRWFQDISVRSSDVSPVVLATAAHAWFVQIHPFIDGNGRTARILLNIILMRNQYPIPVITRDERQRYYDALEASQYSELTPFLDLVYEDILDSMDIYERSAERNMRDRGDYEKIAARLVRPDNTTESQEIAVFSAAMDLLISHFQKIVNDLHDQGAQVYFKQFDKLTPEKYLQIKRAGGVKRTWAFRVDFRRGERSARYLFWFWKTKREMRIQARSVSPVALAISREDPPDEYHYTLLDDLSSSGREDIPEIREVSYDEEAERFICRFGVDRIAARQVADVVKEFVEQVVKRNFDT